MATKQEDRKLYMIRRRKDGLYSTGGTYPGFTNSGKIWNSMKMLNSHLTNVYSGSGWQQAVVKRNKDGRYGIFDFGAFADMKHNPYINCDIVEVELSYSVKTDIFNHLALRYVKDETPATETTTETVT